MSRPATIRSLACGTWLLGALGLVVLGGIALGAGAVESPALAASKIATDAFKKGADDSAACLSPDPKAGLQAFRDCTAQHGKSSQGSESEQDSYLLGLNAQSWAMVNLQSLKAWDAGRQGNVTEQAEAKKAANILQDAAHGYFLDMRKLQKKLNVTDAALCESLGVPYEVLQTYFQFYDHWQ